MKFLKDNWYKLMTGTAMLIFACGFFIYAVSPSYASYNGSSPSKSDYALVPLNKDGSINIKISEEQLNEIKPPAIQSINIEQVRGETAGKVTKDGKSCLGVYVRDGAVQAKMFKLDNHMGYNDGWKAVTTNP